MCVHHEDHHEQSGLVDQDDGGTLHHSADQRTGHCLFSRQENVGRYLRVARLPYTTSQSAGRNVGETKREMLH